MSAKHIRHQPKYPVTNLKGRDTGADSLYVAGKIHAQGPHFWPEQPGHETGEKGMGAQGGGIGSSDRGCADFHPHLARCRMRNRHIEECLNLGWAIAVEHHRLHGFLAGHT